MTISLASLLVQQTKEEIYEYALAVATALELPVTSWRAGDPTRALFQLEAELIEALESVVAGYIASGFLDHAEGDWLEVLAEQVFGVTVSPASYASTTVTLTNAGGGVYTIDAGDLVLKNTTSGATYRNTTGGTLSAGGTLDIAVEAEEAGADFSAAAGEIDDLVTTLLGVTCTNATAAIGTDKQSESTTRQQCRDKLDSLSPNGPAGAYTYVARNSELTGTTAVTRARAYGDSTTGVVNVYVAGSSGAVAAPDVALVEDAIATWATPICITANVASASAVTVAVTYELWVYQSVNKTTAEIEEDVEDALGDMFAAREIGGDIIPPADTGSLYKSLIESTIRGLYPEAFRVSVTTPAGDTALTNSQVAVLGTVTATINLVEDP
jgi:uncharacterized phage protein gp47/JayE